MRRLRSNKKGNLNLLVAGVMTIMMGGALLVFGLIILDNLKTTTSNVARSITNESVTTMNSLGDTLATNNTCGFNNPSIVTIINATGGQIVPSTNYSLSSGGILTSTGAPYNGSNVNVTYTYFSGDEACIASNTSIIGVGSFADYWEIIVLGVVISIVLAMLIGLMGKKSKVM